MPTPYNTPYKKAQRKAKKALRERGKVLWVSHQIVENAPGVWRKRKVQGTYTRAEHGKLS